MLPSTISSIDHQPCSCVGHIYRSMRALACEGMTWHIDSMMCSGIVTNCMWSYEMSVAAIDIEQVSSSSILHLLAGTDGTW